jgi:hypothetical protein
MTPSTICKSLSFSYLLLSFGVGPLRLREPQYLLALCRARIPSLAFQGFPGKFLPHSFLHAVPDVL